LRRTETRRSQRLSDLLLRELAAMLARELGDPRLEEATLTGVRLNPDLTMAEVLYSVHDATHRAEVQTALDKAAGLIRRKLAGRLTLKHMPELRFRHDDFLEDMVYVHPAD
jgi:ribosome-binding factor A